MPTKTGYNVRVQDGQVTDVWDTPAPEGQLGWTAAIEVTPDLTPNREILTTHSIDITKNPIEIVWGKRELEVQERKDSLIGQANFEVQRLEMQLNMKKMNPDAPAEEISALESEIATATTTRDARIAQVTAAVTHEDVDALL
jgi:hypothetical protein